jgi:hypothetical protein
MLKGIMWMKVNDMDEINPIINLFQKFILFYFIFESKINVTQKQYISFFFVFHSLG